MTLQQYTTDRFDEWNAFVASSKNATFLLDRRFMDYHQDRFHDCSLLFYEGKRLVALLPANYDTESRTIYSHQGLTYGGLILSRKTTAEQVLLCFDEMTEWMRTKLGAERLFYKPIPYIYNRYPSEEDLYALFRHNATLHSRGISTCIPLSSHLPLSESRKSGLRKAVCINIRESHDISTFWSILDNVLSEGHSTHPVHTAEEMQLLMERFPDSIRLFAAYDEDEKMLAASWIFDTGTTIHTQYLCATHEGKARGALDKLIQTLISQFEPYRQYLDFGISTEQGGTILNKGLIFQKEGFGGRAICYDCWEIKLNE